MQPPVLGSATLFGTMHLPLLFSDGASKTASLRPPLQGT
jgi:hypothetical protein